MRFHGYRKSIAVGEIMTTTHLTKKAEKYLLHLCLEITSRRVGSAGNQSATTFFAETTASFGFQAECPRFECIDWSEDGAKLTINNETFQVLASPYSLGCQVSAPLSVVSNVAELEAANLDSAIVLLCGEITKEQLMPKNFPFYNPSEHKHIIHLLETKAPKAIIASTSHNPEMAGAMYPFPLIEDGDFDIPSVYMTDIEGKRLAVYNGKQISLDSRARRIPSWGCNAIARKGTGADHRIVLTAHIDGRIGSPGALDNASGVVVLLLLAELLESYPGNLGIELVAINGEDYYDNPGEKQYLQNNLCKLGDILLNINLDDIGYVDGKTAYSMYDCAEQTVDVIRAAFSKHKGILEGQQWYQGDHMIFVQNKVPALAITSERFIQVLAEITHSPKDRPEMVDSARLVDVAQALHELLIDLGAG
jgi:aminopeptidase YwaD